MPNGTEKGLLASSQRRTGLVFDRVSRHIKQLAKEPRASDVHRFRTNSRRIEAIVAEFVPESRSKEKLLRLLSKLRKKAGKLRDLDVQIAFLENLKIPDRQNHRMQLLESLTAQRASRSRRLPRRFDLDTVNKLRKRLRRASSAVNLGGIDPLKRAAERLPNADARQLTESSLHAFRIAAKSARYLAELADSPEGERFVAELKRAQDAIGEWHDVLKLKEQADRRFGRVHESTLLAALNNIAHARFRRASNAAVEALDNVSRLLNAPPVKAPRKAGAALSAVTAA